MRSLRRKRNGPEESIEKLVERHREEDDQPPEPDQREREERWSSVFARGLVMRFAHCSPMHPA